MKKLLLFITLCLLGCEAEVRFESKPTQTNDPDKRALENAAKEYVQSIVPTPVVPKEYPEIFVKQLPYTPYSHNLYYAIIDGCEYLLSPREFMLHKQNCTNLIHQR